MVIREAIEIFREDSSIEDFKKEIELLKSAGYRVHDEYDDYMCFYNCNRLKFNSYIYITKPKITLSNN